MMLDFVDLIRITESVCIVSEQYALLIRSRSIKFRFLQCSDHEKNRLFHLQRVCYSVLLYNMYIHIKMPSVPGYFRFFTPMKAKV